MKAIYTLLLTFAVSSTMAQNLEIYAHGQTTDISGTTITIANGSGSNAEAHYSFDLKNVSGATLNLKVQRHKISETAGSSDYLCWGIGLTGNCYASSSVSPMDPYTSPDSAPFDNNVIGGEALKSYYTPAIYGITHYRYIIINSDDDSKVDSVDVIYDNVLGLDDNKVDFSVYPNPANNILNISISENNTSISIFDIVGKNVVTMKLENGKNILNIESLNSGVYFYSIKKNGQLIETKKLIVK